eukprot:3162832-Amphidinium_carterae.1
MAQSRPTTYGIAITLVARRRRPMAQSRPTTYGNPQAQQPLCNAVAGPRPEASPRHTATKRFVPCRFMAHSQPTT